LRKLLKNAIKQILDSWVLLPAERFVEWLGFDASSCFKEHFSSSWAALENGWVWSEASNGQ